ncbi:hypothetical protein PILCRDRAFT_16021 [Piloderma croceum F 1598]|uniref:RNase H type-1 domain-containing protein n=1 Tax=Piloderma croceum (strain F 1598) TaxID=765440 RepID=A0A0C3EXS5_PILCF|nr:hypothetical protein PILCRDRAFT_16021 [Piloderma croceum F 1598]
MLGGGGGGGDGNGVAVAIGKQIPYEGKVAGAIMAQELLHKESHSFGHHISMYVDNQVSILATQLKTPNLGHYLLDILHTKLT